MGESISPRKNRAGLADLVRKVKDAVNIVEVVGENVVLRKTGSNYVGLCPFHSERTPSFSVNENKQLYHCYGCKRGGDLVTFVMEVSALSFNEALEELLERARIPLPADWNRQGADGKDSEQKRKLQEKQALAFRLNRFTASYFRNGLKADAQARRYLALRGVGPEYQEAFYVGVASGGWGALAEHLGQKKAPLELASELGLVRPSANGTFDLFRNRIVFPILNLRGKVAGFGGRIMSDQDAPKYLNSPESLVFHKSRLAFGLFQAQKYIREKDELILVEGYFDVLTLYAAGFKNVVATCGTALTAEHLNVFKRLASRVVVLFDGDSAGVSATLRAMETGLDLGWVLQGAQLPDGLDPDEVLLDTASGQIRPGGKEQLAELLARARPILDTEIEATLLAGQKDAEAQTQALKKVGKWLARLNDPLGRDVRMERVQKELRVSRSLVVGAVGVGVAGSSRSAGVIQPVQGEKLMQPGVSKNQQLGALDRILLSGLAQGGEFMSAFVECGDRLPPGQGPGSLFEYAPAVEWFSAQGSSLKTVEWSSADEQIRSVVTGVMLAEGTEIQLDQFKAALSKGVAKKWARFSQQLRRQIVQAEAKNDAGLQAKLMKEYLDVQRKMKEFNSFYDEE